MYKRSQFLARMITSTGKQIAIDYVTLTDTWSRKILDEKVKVPFAALAQYYKEDLKPETVRVAML